MFRLTCAIVLMSLALQSFGCDEACKREEAQAKYSTKFPGFLTWNYCDRLAYDFMTTDIESLLSYGSKHFQVKFKGPIKNIVHMIEQREDWLAECDDYLTKTRGERIFYDDKTTRNIFGKMRSAKKELTGVIAGVTYSSGQGDETQVIVQEKFEALYDTVDTHKNLMHLKGKLVYQ